MAVNWHSIEEWGAKHPVALGIGVFVIGAIVIYLIFPKSTPAPANTGPSDAYYQAQAAAITSGNQLSEAQLSAQQHANDTAAALAATQTQIAGNVSIASIQAATADTVTQLQTDAATSIANRQAASTDLASTLAASVAGARVAADQNIAGLNAAAATSQAQIAANDHIATTALQGQTAQFLAQTSAAAATSQAQIAAGENIATTSLQGQTAQFLAQTEAQTARFQTQYGEFNNLIAADASQRIAVAQIAGALPGTTAADLAPLIVSSPAGGQSLPDFTA
jgi:hypothetical protein